jgi:hypothetical protein
MHRCHLPHCSMLRWKCGIVSSTMPAMCGTVQYPYCHALTSCGTRYGLCLLQVMTRLWSDFDTASSEFAAITAAMQAYGCQYKA